MLVLIYFCILLIGVTSISKALNPYLMFFVNTVAECVGLAISFVLKESYSNKKKKTLFLSALAIFPILMILVPEDQADTFTWRSFLILSFSMLGKVVVTVVMCSGYAYNIDMFPTNFKNTLFTV